MVVAWGRAGVHDDDDEDEDEDFDAEKDSGSGPGSSEEGSDDDQSGDAEVVDEEGEALVVGRTCCWVWDREGKVCPGTQSGEAEVVGEEGALVRSLVRSGRGRATQGVRT